MSVPVTAEAYQGPAAPPTADDILPRAASHPNQPAKAQPRRVTIRLAGTARPAGEGHAAQARPAGVLGAASAPEPSAPGAAAAADQLARSASGGLTLRKRGSGTLGGVDPMLRIKPSKAQRMLSDDADSAATAAGAAPRTSARRTSHGTGSTLLQMQGGMGKPTFVELVTAGAFPPGTYEFTVGTAQAVAATVQPSGVILYAGEEHTSISAFALAAARSRNPQRQACDGWKELRLGGRKLEAWRDAYVRGETPPDALQVRSTPDGDAGSN